MALPLPTSLSPSKVSSFTDCALAFRFSAIDKLPEAPSLPAVRGTTVHRALELLFGLEPADRTPEAAEECLAEALREAATDDDYVGLALDDDAAADFAAASQRLLGRYFELEDPRTVHPEGLELLLSAEVGPLVVRGIIDRLETDADGELVVTDYKTGRAPSQAQERSRLAGVHFYSLLCEKVLGRRPAKVQLIYLGGDPQIITTRPTEQSTRAVERKLGAVWQAIEQACEREDFRPRPSALCSWCSYQAYCPAQGGDLGAVPVTLVAAGAAAATPAATPAAAAGSAAPAAG